MSKTKTWTKDEISFLEKNAQFLTTKELSNKLNRTRYAVYQKLRMLGLYTNSTNKNK